MSAPFRIARVVLSPRERALLALDTSAAGQRIQRAFGACCVQVSGVMTADDASWRATVVVDGRAAKDAKDAKLLSDHANDERLWKSFIEALYTDGTCDVLELEAATAPPALAQPKPR